MRSRARKAPPSYQIATEMEADNEESPPKAAEEDARAVEKDEVTPKAAEMEVDTPEAADKDENAAEKDAKAADKQDKSPPKAAEEDAKTAENGEKPPKAADEGEKPDRDKEPAEMDVDPPEAADKDEKAAEEEAKAEEKDEKPPKEEGKDDKPPRMADREKEMFRMMHRERDFFRMMRGRRGRERDMEFFRMRRMMMLRGGFDRDMDPEMEMEMMMMYRMYGEEFEFEYREPTEEEKREEENRKDQQALMHYCNSRMLSPMVLRHGNLHHKHDDMVRYVEVARFEPIVSNTHRFYTSYLSYKDIPDEDTLIDTLSRFACAAFNNREEEVEKIFVLLCGVEEDLDTQVYPLATGIPYLDPKNDEKFIETYKKVMNRASKRRQGIKDSDFSSIDEGMTKFTTVLCDQSAARNPAPLPVGLFTVHPNWTFCANWAYMYGPVDDNRKYSPKPHDFENGRAVPMIYAEKIQKMEEYFEEAYKRYRKEKGYYY